MTTAFRATRRAILALPALLLARGAGSARMARRVARKAVVMAFSPRDS